MPPGIELQLLDWIQQVYDGFGWPGVLLLMAVESACVPLPSELVMPLSGWMLVQAKGHGVGHLFLVALLGALGNLLGSLVAYWIGAKGGRAAVERYGRYLLVSHRDLERAERWFARYGDLAVFLSRLLPVVRTFISLPAGMARMPVLRFSVLTLLGAFPWCLGLAYGGYLMGDNWEALRRVMRPLDIPIGVALVALLALFLWRRVRQRRHHQGPI